MIMHSKPNGVNLGTNKCILWEMFRQLTESDRHYPLNKPCHQIHALRTIGLFPLFSARASRCTPWGLAMRLITSPFTAD